MLVRPCAAFYFPMLLLVVMIKRFLLGLRLSQIALVSIKKVFSPKANPYTLLSSNHKEEK
jgi:hypothetical protein